MSIPPKQMRLCEPGNARLDHRMRISPFMRDTASEVAVVKQDALRLIERSIDPACMHCGRVDIEQYVQTNHATTERTVCTSAVCKGQLEYVEVAFDPRYPMHGDSHKVSRRCPDGYVSEGNFVSNRTPPDVDWMSDEDSSFVAYRPDLSPTPKIDKDKPQVDIDFW